MFAGYDKIAIIVDRNGVHMNIVNVVASQICNLIVQQIKIIPASPFKYHIPILIQLLKHISLNAGIPLPTIDDLAHIDRYRFFAGHQDVSIFKHDKLVIVPMIAVSRSDNFSDIKVFIQNNIVIRRKKIC